MVNEHTEFWSKVAQKYDRVVDLQLGPQTRSMVLERVAKEDRLGQLAEFGCGTGFYTQVLAEKADRAVATDLAPGMLALARGEVKATNVTFQVEDCQKTSFSDGLFDTVFLGLVLHFTEPEKTLAEMRRILKLGGTLLIVNVDVGTLTGFDRIRGLIRIVYRGITGYGVRPPKGFGKNMMTEKQLCDLLGKLGFTVVSTEMIKDPSHSSNVPVEYIRAVKA